MTKKQFKSLIKKLEKKRVISRKPRPVYVFLLAFSYFLVWYVAYILYDKYELIHKEIIINLIGILSIFAFIFAIVHLGIVIILKDKS